MSDEKIKKAMPGRRDPASLELQHALIIPKGTILRQEIGKPGVFTAPIAGGSIQIDDEGARKLPSTFKRVVTA